MDRIRCWFPKQISKDGTGRRNRNILKEEEGTITTFGKIDTERR